MYNETHTNNNNTYSAHINSILTLIIKITLKKNIQTDDIINQGQVTTPFTYLSHDHQVRLALFSSTYRYRWSDAPQVETTTGGFLRVYFKTSPWRQEKGFTCTVWHLGKNLLVCLSVCLFACPFFIRCLYVCMYLYI